MKERIAVGVPAALLFLFLFWYGNWPFLIFTYILGTIGLFELIRIKKLRFLSFPTLISYLFLWYLLLPETIKDKLVWSQLEIIYFVVACLLSYTVFSKNKFNFVEASYLLMTSFYVGISFYYLHTVRSHVGFVLSLLVVLLIWSSDSGAYFVGRKLGKNKLWPTISPNKTVEGLFGGIAVSLIVAFSFYMISNDVEIKHVLLGITVPLIGTLGDLVQSAYKRYFAVKDSGAILPGHGGVLDRFDSLMFTLPLLVFFHILPL